MLLLTGGSGRLGRVLRRQIQCVAPPRDQFDVCRPHLPNYATAIVHCAAYTDVSRAETERDLCRQVNVDAVRKLSGIGVPLLYVSTEYVFDGKRGNYREDDERAPVNWYAATKALGEDAALAGDALVVRLLFKPRPFPHAQACVDQWTSGDYVDVIAPLLAQAVAQFVKGLRGVLHIGTGRKSTFDLALQSRPVSPVRRANIGVALPMDTSLNCERWHSLWT